ncbi:PRPF39 [Symbiodinium sp. KB8]|nr:PRPF39 [Symbiodinium sp. KB8]
MDSHLEVSPGRSTSSTAPFPHRDGGLLQDTSTFPEMKDEDEPQPGVVLKLAEVTGCDLDTCCAALVACDNNFHAALDQLRSVPGAEEVGAKARAQMRAALQMLERARAGRSVTRGALGSAWVVAAILLHAFEYMPKRFLEILLALVGVRVDGPFGLLALTGSILIALLAVVVLLRDLDGFLNSENLEGKMGGHSGLQVYRRALAIAPACVDLWVQYCEAAGFSDEVNEDSLRKIFEEAVETVGRDWRAFPLWDLYFNFEERGRRWKRLGCLLQRALDIPMQGLPAVRVRLRSLILGDAAPPLEALCFETDAPTTERMLDAKSEDADAEVGAMSHSIEENSEAPPPSHPPPPAEAAELEDGELHDEDDSDQDGEIHEEEEPPTTVQLEAAVPAAGFSSVGTQRSPNTDSTSLVGKVSAAGAVARFKGAEELDASDRAEHFLSLREELWNKTSSEAAVLMQYEAPLHRQYFHNKPLSQAQLDAWRSYLDFEESRHPREWQRLCALFERCLVVTNNYLEFWLRYARALKAMEEQACKPEAACTLLRGACLNGRLSRRPDALAAWAELEEQCGRPHRACALLDAALQTCGMGSTELAIRRVALEMRRSDASSAASLLEKFVLQTVNLNSRSFLSRRYARLMEDCQRQPNKAAKFLTDAWKAGCRDSGLLLELTALLMRTAPDEGPGKLARCMALFEEAIHAASARQARNVPVIEEVSQLWACYVDFLLTHGASLEILHNVQDRARSFRCRCQAVSHDATGTPITPTKKRRSSDLSPEKTTELMAVKQAGAQRARTQQTWITDSAERECVRQCSIAAGA